MNNTEFSILQADVILSSVSADKQVVDIRNKVVQLDFYENLYKPYVDARIVMMDDFGFKNSLSIQGTERLRVVLGSDKNPEDPVVVKYFFFSRIVDSQKSNERAEVLSIDLVEDHVYINAVKQISRSFESNLEDMIVNILSRDLGMSTDATKFGGSVQGVRKVLLPYLSPLEAIYWLKDRVTTKTGSPMFVHGDLYSDIIYLTDLEKLLQEQPVNVEFPFMYNEALSSASDEEQLLRSFIEIKSFKEIDGENSLNLYEEGAIGSYYANIDANTGFVSGKHISIRDIVTEMYLNDMIDPSSSQSLFDPSLEIDGKLSDEYNSLFIHQVTSSNTYNQFQSYHDEAIILDNNNNLVESKLKVKNKIIRQILKKNRIEVNMNGKFFFNGKVSVGKKVRILFVNPDVTSDNSDISNQIDYRKSGDFLILAIHHNLPIGENHNTTLRLTKLGDLPSNIKL
jgi:hypothetical protein